MLRTTVRLTRDRCAGVALVALLVCAATAHAVVTPPIGYSANGNVVCFAQYNNQLIAGGTFTSIGGITANHIASWDGRMWHALTTGVSGGTAPTAVNALTVMNNVLYVTGAFSTAGGVKAMNVATWDSKVWHALGSGLGGRGDTKPSGTTIAVYKGAIVAGGNFAYAGNVLVNGIARWDGRAWGSVAQGVAGGIPYTMLAQGSMLIVGGSFTRAGTASAAHLAAFDGTKWVEYAGGTDTTAYVVAPCLGFIAVGGDFTSVGGGGGARGASSVAANHIAIWTGATWMDIAGVSGGTSPTVYGLAGNEVTLYVVGRFTTAGRTNAANVASFDGYAWRALGTGLDGTGRAAALYGGGVFAGGDFKTAGGVSAQGIAEYLNGAWHDVGGRGAAPVTAAPAPPASAVLADAGETAAIALDAPHPNPVHGSATLSFHLARAGLAQMDVYDAQGAQRSRITWGALSAGAHSVTWAARDVAGHMLPAGRYWLRLRAGGATASQRVLVLP